jgi:hypothetical protein
MLASVWLSNWQLRLPEWLAGLVGVLLLVLSLMDSLKQRDRVDT